MTAPNFTQSGYIVHKPDPSREPPDVYEGRGSSSYASDFQGRIPIIVRDRNIYAGNPNWFHHDVESHHNIGYSSSLHDDHGYFNSPNEQWGGGNLSWYGQRPDEHEDIAQALSSAGYNIPNGKPEQAGGPPPLDDLFDRDEHLWQDLDDPPELDNEWS